MDDVTPESLGYLIDRLLGAGADDAWITPVVMKKSRPAHAVTVICQPALAGEMRALLFQDTGTLGMRQRNVEKFVLPRHIEKVDVLGTTVRVKVGPYGAKPEHDDLVALAALRKLALSDARERALEKWRSSGRPGELGGEK